MEKNSWYSIHSSDSVSDVSRLIINGFEARNWVVETRQKGDQIAPADNTTDSEKLKEVARTEIHIVRYPNQTSSSDPIPIILTESGQGTTISTLNPDQLIEYNYDLNENKNRNLREHINIIEENINSQRN